MDRLEFIFDECQCSSGAGRIIDCDSSRCCTKRHLNVVMLVHPNPILPLGSKLEDDYLEPFSCGARFDTLIRVDKHQLFPGSCLTPH